VSLVSLGCCFFFFFSFQILILFDSELFHSVVSSDFS
jgi:hypothetical protein